MQPTPHTETIIISLQKNTTEIHQLAHTLNYTVIKTFIQHRDLPDVNYYVGIGKVEEISTFLKEHPTITIVIVDDELKPSQWFNLEKHLKITVYDRIRLILAIFEERAERKEAKLQVKFAQLRYERPYVRELIHRARAGEHPGFMAGGEYQVDDYYETIKKQIKKIRLDLKKIENARTQQRKHRQIKGYYLISLAGYTNAGKSSMMNTLTKAHVPVEGKLFSTLSTTTRKLVEKSKQPLVPILLTDTVGFIDHLPAWVIDAFHATLEEIQMADLVLLIADASEEHDELLRKLRVSYDELHSLNVTAPSILVLNKTDLLIESSKQNLSTILEQTEFLDHDPYLFVSTKNNSGISPLISLILETLPNLISLRLFLPNSPETNSFISELYNTTYITDISYANDVKIHLICNPHLLPKIQQLCNTVHGTCDEAKTKT
ncbi:MAG: GTPase HflX [Candidatus Thermoplasmatota archaeon]|nr:GTPase HflX [Candidatus Thermoplasmatota archaeon]MBU1940397.1 GTPase HflX [Candidatus Thermoplasmatota archaeon]